LGCIAIKSDIRSKPEYIDVLCEEARQAAETALTLQPNLGEAVLAKGYYRYSCLKDYDTAVRYFEQARQLLPNNSLVLESLGYVARRRGRLLLLCFGLIRCSIRSVAIRVSKR
jgi:tetratricopeptide (TPR) repeat protein